MSEPVISYPPELPVSAARDEIAAAIRDHQVVVVAGATGSGKTTQLPKICLELGRTSIAHTQPRRIAARSVAERIAEELQVPLGDAVGYKVRFTDKVSADTRVALMTDGILLNEIHRDRLLRRYDTIIIDEAHERSLNVDFLIGYLRRILPERPELKVIITSATIDPHSFARHFARPSTGSGTGA
ncbi:MAG TPA: DEAD/DEAH box helicase, partial [Microbacterium sp.]|nr:DEAD/DEAH box helicase [Microbacterium sp.]